MRFDVLSDGLIQASAPIFVQLVIKIRPQGDGFVKGKLIVPFGVPES